MGGEEILLRPTFANMQATEQALGSMPYLAYKYGKGSEIDPVTGKIKVNPDSLPGLADCAKIVFLNQEPKKLTQEQVFELVLAEGIKVALPVMTFLLGCSNGNKLAPDLSPAEKKS